MNNSVTHPQGRGTVRYRVDRWGRVSTPGESANMSPTRHFATSSTIHTPYYDYSIPFNHPIRRREGTTCAYPS